MKILTAMVRAVLVGMLYVYKYLVSPVIHALAPGGGCRFEPTCSEYALEAVRRRGPFMGAYLAVRRISRCHPWGACGYDPVPDGCSCTRRKDHQHPSPLESSHTREGSANRH